jgi:hypothetical protein
MWWSIIFKSIIIIIQIWIIIDLWKHKKDIASIKLSIVVILLWSYIIIFHDLKLL